MHKLAIEVPEAAGRRFISVSSSPKWTDLARPIVNKYGPLGWPVPTQFERDSDRHYISIFDVTPTREVLGFEYRDIATTAVDLAD